MDKSLIKIPAHFSSKTEGTNGDSDDKNKIVMIPRHDLIELLKTVEGLNKFKRSVQALLK